MLANMEADKRKAIEEELQRQKKAREAEIVKEK